MDPDERKWLQSAIEAAQEASQKNVTVLLVRRNENEADLLVTNANNSEAIAGMALAMNGPGEVCSSEG
jgi:hypothetical protein